MSWVHLPSSGQEYVGQEGFLAQRLNVGEEDRVVIVPFEAEVLTRHRRVLFLTLNVYSHLCMDHSKCVCSFSVSRCCGVALHNYCCGCAGAVAVAAVSTWALQLESCSVRAAVAVAAAVVGLDDDSGNYNNNNPGYSSLSMCCVLSH